MTFHEVAVQSLGVRLRVCREGDEDYPEPLGTDHRFPFALVAEVNTGDDFVTEIGAETYLTQEPTAKDKDDIVLRLLSDLARTMREQNWKHA